MLLLATLDKPILRHHVRSTTEKDAAQLVLVTYHLVEFR